MYCLYRYLVYNTHQRKYPMDSKNYLRFCEARDCDVNTAANFIPFEWKFDKGIVKAMTLASYFHIGQLRKFSGLPVFIDHIIPVGIISYDYARKYEFNPVKAAIIGLLHDSLEDGNQSGFTTEYIQTMIFESFGMEILQQIELLTVTNYKFEKELTDEDKTFIWLQNRYFMDNETKVVKLADIYSNSDGISLRPAKFLQRRSIIHAVGRIAPELRDLCLRDLRLC